MKNYLYRMVVVVTLFAGQLTPGNVQAADAGVVGSLENLQEQVTNLQATLNQVLAQLTPGAKATTTLLWPFATTLVGFDSAITIANTSSPNGTCTLTFHGTNAPAPVTTPTITPDAIFVSLVSSMAPDFQGFIIAVCNFPRARGWGLFSDVGLRNVAASIPVEVLP